MQLALSVYAKLLCQSLNIAKARLENNYKRWIRVITKGLLFSYVLLIAAVTKFRNCQCILSMNTCFECKISDELACTGTGIMMHVPSCNELESCKDFTRQLSSIVHEMLGQS